METFGTINQSYKNAVNYNRKKQESGPLKKYIYNVYVCIFFKHLQKNVKISSSVPNSTQYKAKKLYYYTHTIHD